MKKITDWILLSILPKTEKNTNPDIEQITSETITKYNSVNEWHSENNVLVGTEYFDGAMTNAIEESQVIFTPW